MGPEQWTYVAMNSTQKDILISLYFMESKLYFLKKAVGLFMLILIHSKILCLPSYAKLPQTFWTGLGLVQLYMSYITFL